MDFHLSLPGMIDTKMPPTKAVDVPDSTAMNTEIYFLTAVSDIEPILSPALPRHRT